MKRNGSNRAMMSSKTQLPKGWRLVRLGDVAHIRSNLALAGEDGRTPYVALEHILSGGRLTSYGKSADSVSTKTRFREGDTLYGKLRPNLRKVIRAEFDGVCSTEILAIFAKGKWDWRFLSHLIRSDLLHGHAMQGITGTKMPRTSWGHLKTFEFLSPPLPEQRAIAAVLDSIGDAIEGTEAVIAATEQLRGSLLHELLTRGVPGWHTEWKEAPGLGTMPADWGVVRLGEVIEDGPTNGIYKPDSEYGSGVCLIRIDDFAFGEFVNFGDFKRIRATEEEIRRFQIREGDVVINRVNSLSHIGKSVLVPEVNEPTLFESNMMKIRFDRGLDPRFGAMVLLSDNTRRYFKARAKKAVQQASINQQDVGELPLPCPTLPEQQAIATVLDGMDVTIAEAKRERDGLQLLKESAADALLTGRVRVRVGERDE